MRIAILVLISVVAFHAKADHERGFFVGGTVTYIKGEELPETAGNSDKVEVPGLEIVAGYKYNGLLGADVRYGGGLGDDELGATETGDQVEYSVDSYYAVYYRPELTNPEAKLYGLLGYASVDGTLEITDTETDFSDSGISVGLGAGWFIDDTLTFNVELRRLIDEDSGAFDIGTMGLDYRF